MTFYGQNIHHRAYAYIIYYVIVIFFFSSIVIDQCHGYAWKLSLVI